MVAWLKFGLGLMVASGLGAQTDRLHFPQLHLRNGIVMQDATLLSVDPRTQRVTVVDGQRRMSTVPVTLLPGVVQQQLGILPTVGGTTRVGREAPRPAPTAPRPASAAAPATRAASAPPAPPAAPPPPNTAAIKAFVREHVEFYFTHEYRPGTGSVIVLSNMILLREPRPIVNWPGRHRVQGRVGLRYYDSGMGSFATRTRSFTAEVRQLPSGEWEMVSFQHR